MLTVYYVWLTQLDLKKNDSKSSLKFASNNNTADRPQTLPRIFSKIHLIRPNEKKKVIQNTCRSYTILMRSMKGRKEKLYLAKQTTAKLFIQYISKKNTGK